MNLCKRLRDLRASAGLTQIELAARAGVSRRTVAEIELSANANPTRATLGSLADALGVSVADLMADDAPEPTAVAS